MSDSKQRVAQMSASTSADMRSAAAAIEGITSGGRDLRPYVAPRILSREPLEAAANVCDPLFNGKADMFVCPLGASNS